MKLRTGQDGIKLSLFDLEAEIMEIVWDLNQSHFTVSDVVEVISSNRDVAYTTIMTTISRLFEKGLLEREKVGRKYQYRALQSRQEYIVQLTKDVIQQLPPIGQQAAISMLVEHIEDADDDELLRLEEMIRQKRLNSEGDKI